MSWCMMTAIVRKGQARGVMAAAREAGAPGGTVCLARGTATSTILAALGIGDTRQEVLISVIEEDKAEAIHSRLLRDILHRREDALRRAGKGP